MLGRLVTPVVVALTILLHIKARHGPHRFVAGVDMESHVEQFRNGEEDREATAVPPQPLEDARLNVNRTSNAKTWWCEVRRIMWNYNVHVYTDGWSIAV